MLIPPRLKLCSLSMLMAAWCGCMKSTLLLTASTVGLDCFTLDRPPIQPKAYRCFLKHTGLTCNFTIHAFETCTLSRRASCSKPH